MRLQRQRKAHGREGGDAPQAKGTKRRQSQGRTPPFQGRGGRSMYITSFSQPASPGRRRGEEKAGSGEPAEKLPASFRLNKSCTFLLAPPRGSSPPQKTSFCSFTPKKVFLDTFSSFYSLLQRARPSQPTLPRTGGGGFRTTSAGAAGVGRGLGEEMGAAGPWMVPPRRGGGQGVLLSPLGNLHLLKGPCQVGCANVAGLLCFKNSH